MELNFVFYYSIFCFIQLNFTISDPLRFFFPSIGEFYDVTWHDIDIDGQKTYFYKLASIIFDVLLLQQKRKGE